MSAFDPQAVQAYIDQGDRESPLFFCGRDEEQTLVGAIISNLQRGKTQGNTILFHGAPGAGKTALLQHIKSSPPADLDVAFLPASLLNDPKEALNDVFAQLQPAQAARAKREQQTTHVLGLSIGGIKGERRSTQRVSGEDIRTIRHLMDTRGGSSKPLILIMDEAQNANSDLPDGKSSILQQLHEGSEAPVALVAGGLSDSVSRLRDLGISRESKGHFVSLQPLTDAEVSQAFEAFVNHKEFGITRCVDDCIRYNQIEKLVVEESMGWPQHLTNALAALGKEMILKEGILENCSLAKVQTLSQGARLEYYSGRTKGIPSPLLREVAKAIPKGAAIDEYDVHKVVERTYKAEPIIARTLNEEDAFGALLHQGVLQCDNRNLLGIPIPSMHDFMAGKTSH